MTDDQKGGVAPGLLTVPEAAQLLRISRNLAYELVARNELPAVRLGRAIRVPRRELEAWIAEHANGSREPTSMEDRTLELP